MDWGAFPERDEQCYDYDVASFAVDWLGGAPSWGTHCTVTGGDIFYDDADVGEIKARLAWQAGLFGDEQTRTIHVTAVHLVERVGDGACTVVASYPLTGAP